MPAHEGEAGTGAGHGCDSACHRQGGVPDVEVRGGIRDDRRGRVRAEVQRSATQVHEDEGSEVGIPARPGLNVGTQETKGVLTRRTPTLHLIGSDNFAVMTPKTVRIGLLEKDSVTRK
jgi:hypothetical protein